MTDYKQLCAKVLAYYEGQGEYDFSNLGAIARDNAAFDAWQEIRNELKSALSEPEPEGPTDEEIMELMPQQMREDLAAAARAITDQANTYDTKAKGMMRIILNRHCVDHARAVLTRWGRPAPQPVPVSERLPGPEECLDEGWAWFFNPRTGWRQATQPVHSTYTHWLPAHALPVPS